MTNCPDCGESMRVGYAHMCDVINNYPDILPITNISHEELLDILGKHLIQIKFLEERYGIKAQEIQNLRSFYLQTRRNYD